MVQCKIFQQVLLYQVGEISYCHTRNKHETQLGYVCTSNQASAFNTHPKVWLPHLCPCTCTKTPLQFCPPPPLVHGQPHTGEEVPKQSSQWVLQCQQLCKDIYSRLGRP